MTDKWNLFVDIEKCNGCQCCFLAVKDEYVGNEEPDYFAPQPLAQTSWFRVDHIEQGQAPFTEVNYLPQMCQHCDDAACVKVGRDGAVTKRDDGIVIIHPEKAKGQKQIVDACPHNAIYWNEELQLPQAWLFDAHLLDQGWKRPRVEQVCVTGALKAIKMTDHDRQKKIELEDWRELRPELQSKPRVFYKGLDRIQTIFVAGSVEIARDTGNEPAVGILVEYLVDDEVVSSITTDDFGDFKLNRLQPSKKSTIRMTLESKVEFEKDIALEDSMMIERVIIG